LNFAKQLPSSLRMILSLAGRSGQVTSGGSGSETEAVVFDDRFDASTLHLLRERVGACAAAAGMPPDRAADVILAVHELAANVVSHGAGAGRLLIRAAVGALRCQVTDAGPGEGPWPVRKGHGLWIVRAVADEVTASLGPHGSQVTALFGWRVTIPANQQVT
jgi:anti-sigma regulatory factor (Ser/Thr protein kinase)